MTYQNLLVTKPRLNNPILRPVLIHKTKNLPAIPLFWLNSNQIESSSDRLESFWNWWGTELIKVFRLLFPEAVHLRCTNHLRQNKFRDLNCSTQSVCNEFCADVFGRKVGSHFEAGRADFDSPSSFDKALKTLEPKWNNLKRSCNPSKTEPQFHSWFVQ